MGFSFFNLEIIRRGKEKWRNVNVITKVRNL